jgi:hypothetical protein
LTETKTAAAGTGKSKLSFHSGKSKLNFNEDGSTSVEFLGSGPTGSKASLQIGESNTCTNIDGSECVGETLRSVTESIHKIQATLNDPCAAGSPLKSLCDKVAALETAQTLAARAPPPI